MKDGLKWMAAFSVGALVIGECTASIVVPEWAGEPGATTVQYAFPSDANPPVPDALTNAYTNAYRSVQGTIVPGYGSAGWMDPKNEFHVTREDGTGAWNITSNGYINVEVPFVANVQASSQVEVWIDVIAYYGITLLPDITVSGTTIEYGTYQFLEENDEGFAGASWQHQVWTGIVEVVNTDSVTVNISGNPNKGSLVDRVSVYTQVVPEPPPPTSSGIDLRAYQGADGIYVEFVAYDVEADGTIMLALMDANGEVIWQGSVDVTAGPAFFARFLVPGLELGGTYNFQVRDEVGKWWDANGVMVQPFAAEMVSASLTEIELKFDSLPEREYDIQWTAQLGGTWQTVDTVTAMDKQTTVVVACPDPDQAGGFFRVRLK